MGYFILLLTIIVYLIRPAEWIPALYFNWNMLLNGLGVIAIAGIAMSRKNKFHYDRTTLFLFWFIFSMMLSNVINGQFYTIGIYFSQVLSTLVIFLLTQTAISKPKQVEKLILLIIYLILFICYQCHLQYTTGINWGGLEPISRSLGIVDPETGLSISRELQVVWFGTLQDPNDLGMLLIAFMPYIVSRIFYQELSFAKKVFWLLAFFVIAYTIILTNSRGSMLSLIGGLACFYIIKKRSVAGYVAAGIIAIVLLAFSPSRMGELGSGDYSAMGRIYAWILALELLAMNPFFGIGATHFLDFHALTTHNSYVLAMVENGLIGFLCYFSMIVVSVYTMIKVAYSVEDRKKSIEIISLVSGMLGILISIFFISRTYALLPYLYIAIMMTYVRVNFPDLHHQYVNKLGLIKLSIISISFILFIYLFNRIGTLVLI